MLEHTNQDANETIDSWQKRLRRSYVLAFLLIVLSIAVGGFILTNALKDQETDAQTLNIAGAQRMLSQRVAALSYALASSTTQAETQALTDQLKQTLKRMDTGHKYLVETDGDGAAHANASEALAAIYAPSGKNLEARVFAFIANAEAWLASVANREEAQAIPVVPAQFTALLKDLDQAVSLYEAAANKKVKDAQFVHKLSIVLAFIVLLIEARFVFWPLASYASGRMRAYDSVLKQRSNLLSKSMRVAKLGYWHVSNTKPGSIWVSEELATLYRLEASSQGWMAIEQLKDLVYDQRASSMAAIAKKCRDTGEDQSIKSRMQCQDGTILEVTTQISPTLDASGTVVALTGVVIDTTESVEAQRELQAKSEELSEAHKLGSTAIWRADIGATLMNYGEDIHTLLRYDTSSPDGNLPLNGLPLQSICVGTSFEDMYAAATTVVETSETQTIDVKLRRGDNTIADIALRLKLESDEDGKPLQIFGTMQDVTDQRDAQRQLEQLAYYDHLTGLANRALCTRRLKKACEQAASLHITSALILIDLDNFKEINDGLGHQAGDEFLCEVGKRLAQIAGPNNVCARLGGDEFAVIVTRVGDLLELDVMVSKMLAAITMPAKLAAGEASGSGSAGICIIPADTTAYDEALQFADLALYDAKNSGRNQSSFFDASMSLDMQKRLNLSRDLKGAIQSNELETHFQPIISSKTGKVSGFETLMRWNHPIKGWISPAEFIPVAESSHLIGHIGAFALQDACSHAKYWAERRNEEYEVSVNVSAAQLWHGDLEKVINDALEMSQLPAHLLCIELTESVFVGDSIDRIEGLLKRLKSRGIQLALDDFGTGYSSLGYLNNLPFDKLKIDRCFVSGVDISPERRRLLGGIVGLARGLDMEIVAEGVETADELDAVLSMGCHYIQGFYFGKAQPAHMAIEMAETINQKAPEFDADAVRKEMQLRAI